MTSRKGVQIATAALFTNPSILGRGDSADLFVDSWQLEAIITTLVVNLVASQSVRSTATMWRFAEEHSS